MPESRFDEITGRRSFGRACFRRCRELERFCSNNRSVARRGRGANCGTTPSTTAASSATPEPSKALNGNSHVVARGETLTSIARMHNVSVSELQKYNHIDNPLKLQAGQTLLIPPSAAASPFSSGE